LRWGALALIQDNRSPSLDTGEIKIFENNLRENRMLPSYLNYLETFKSFVDVVKQADIKDQRQGLPCQTNFE